MGISGVSNAVLHARGNVSLTFDNNDLIYFVGSNSTMYLDKSGGNAIVAWSVNQTISCLADGANSIYDEGRGLTLHFSQCAMSPNEISVYGFQNDRSGKVDARGQTATQSSDGHGGSWLTLSGLFGGETIHFVNDPHVKVVT